MRSIQASVIVVLFLVSFSSGQDTETLALLEDLDVLSSPPADLPTFDTPLRYPEEEWKIILVSGSDGDSWLPSENGAVGIGFTKGRAHEPASSSADVRAAWLLSAYNGAGFPSDNQMALILTYDSDEGAYTLSHVTSDWEELESVTRTASALTQLEVEHNAGNIDILVRFSTGAPIEANFTTEFFSRGTVDVSFGGADSENQYFSALAGTLLGRQHPLWAFFQTELGVFVAVVLATIVVMCLPVTFACKKGRQAGEKGRPRARLQVEEAFDKMMNDFSLEQLCAYVDRLVRSKHSMAIEVGVALALKLELKARSEPAATYLLTVETLADALKACKNAVMESARAEMSTVRKRMRGGDTPNDISAEDLSATNALRKKMKKIMYSKSLTDMKKRAEEEHAQSEAAALVADNAGADVKSLGTMKPLSNDFDGIDMSSPSSRPVSLFSISTVQSVVVEKTPIRTFLASDAGDGRSEMMNSERAPFFEL